MAASYFFYDLETSGIKPTSARIMQFAGQRTDMDLNPIGDPVNVLIKLAGDVLPEPEAILLTGITPQSTIIDGLTEAEFLHFFYDEVVTPDTTFLGYNTVRFDDEFMRVLHYRNFYDPYEWHWANGCSRWDILDLVRMTRALRPDGIEWPVTPEGKPTNRLELLTKVNHLDHDHAHDALSDVTATIAVAKLIRDTQPDLFKYVFESRGKKQVASIVETGQPCIYTSGRYPSSVLHTSPVVMLAKQAQNDSALVYDLRVDPTPFLSMTAEQLADLWRYKKDRSPDDPRMPVKTLKYNRCPAIAPLGVIKDATTQERLGVTLQTISQNLGKLKNNTQDFARKLMDVVAILDTERANRYTSGKITPETVDGMLYDGFVGNEDKQVMRAVRIAEPADIMAAADRFKDQRLQVMAPLYKARNYPTTLSAEERQAWEQHVSKQLFDGGKITQYFGRLQQLASGGKLTSEQSYLLEELQLYGESIVPSDISGQE